MRKRASNTAVVAAVAWGAIAVACRPHQGGTDDDAPGEPAVPVAETSEPVRIVYPSAPGSFVKIVGEVAPSVVAIRSTRKVVGGPASEFPGVDDDHALGTGFVIDRNGYILTNDHLIANAPELVVVLSGGDERAAAIAGRDPKLDLALLKIEASATLVPLALGDSAAVETGEWVIALGNPFATGVAISAGVVSRAPSPAGGGLLAPRRDFYHQYLATDASIHAGNSGGPLINAAGEAIGIATAVERGGPIGYGIPINRARDILPMLKEEGMVTRAWLGVFVQPVTKELAARLALAEPAGAFVADVIQGAPAAKAGIRRGDVILEFDGRAVDDKSLPAIAATAGIGRQIPVIISRSGEQRTLELRSEKMPE